MTYFEILMSSKIYEIHLAILYIYFYLGKLATFYKEKSFLDFKNMEQFRNNFAFLAFFFFSLSSYCSENMHMLRTAYEHQFQSVFPNEKTHMI